MPLFERLREELETEVAAAKEAVEEARALAGAPLRLAQSGEKTKRAVRRAQATMDFQPDRLKSIKSQPLAGSVTVEGKDRFGNHVRYVERPQSKVGKWLAKRG